VGLVGFMVRDKGEVTGTARCQQLNLLLLIIYLGALTHHVVRISIQYGMAKNPDTFKSAHPTSARQLSGRLIFGPYPLPPNLLLNDLTHRLQV
jgi:hypothetical protein